MFKLVFFVSMVACALAAPAPGVVVGAPLVTATSSQVVARNYNAALAVAPAPLLAPAPVLRAAPLLASPFAAPLAAPLAAPIAPYAAYAAAPAIAAPYSAYPYYL